MKTAINMEDNYFPLLKSLKKNTKLRLIRRLTDSLLEDTDTGKIEEDTDKILNRLAGCWKNDKDAELIADEISKSRTSGITRHIASLDE